VMGIQERSCIKRTFFMAEVEEKKFTIDGLCKSSLCEKMPDAEIWPQARQQGRYETHGSAFRTLTKIVAMCIKFLVNTHP
jgi:hypothetical protein